MIPFSILDLSPIREGETPREAFAHTVELARHAESLGFHRFWIAEHHNLPGIASAATAVVIGHVAGATSRIRVGAGGIMLPNHAPMVIAEQFGTLESLYPGRIDLGLGRAPGGDAMVLRALRRSIEGQERFPRDVQELQFFFQDPDPQQTIRAVPGAGLSLPLWLLGSSTYSAGLAAALGLPFAFASHFAPGDLGPALALYRQAFVPSPTLAAPRVMIAVTVCAADTNAEARHLFTSLQRSFLELNRGKPGRLPPPVDDIAALGTAQELARVDKAMRLAIVGGPETVRQGLEMLIETMEADELIVMTQAFDQAATLRSFEIVAAAREGLTVGRAAA